MVCNGAILIYHQVNYMILYYKLFIFLVAIYNHVFKEQKLQWATLFKWIKPIRKIYSVIFYFKEMLIK